ncbi:NAD(P)-binding protein [Melanomma pulvis-pyrius CBS 109.77]|uniref:NAD(P)-binding protein n=1 Tax=Melanomma pulvis-pyrius CBS 109.77 TaxID=1314802 RepID=A0A6A6XNB6_9PLEO|nr:NAD(P)-binding protein [Melanomma pulvis-pyrius CBS 109.77]
MKYAPETDIPDLSGKIIFITGGTSGIGQEAIIHLAKHNAAHIYFTGRSEAGAKSTNERVVATSSSTKLTFIKCDQSDLNSIKTAVATQFKHDVLDVLITNAGMSISSASLSKDGYEIHFATNHVAHALYIKLLLPALLRRAKEAKSDVRIIQLASAAAYNTNSINLATIRTTQEKYFAGGLIRYSQSKLANVVYTIELAERYPQILIVSLHPGIVDTPMLGRQPIALKYLLNVVTYVNRARTPLLKPDEGSYNTVWAATSDRQKITTGAYYEPVGLAKKMSKAMGNRDLSKELWEWTEKELERF